MPVSPFVRIAGLSGALAVSLGECGYDGSQKATYVVRRLVKKRKKEREIERNIERERERDLDVEIQREAKRLRYRQIIRKKDRQINNDGHKQIYYGNEQIPKYLGAYGAHVLGQDPARAQLRQTFDTANKVVKPTSTPFGS